MSKLYNFLIFLKNTITLILIFILVFGFSFFYFFSSKGNRKIIFYNKVISDLNTKNSFLKEEYNFLEEKLHNIKNNPLVLEYNARNKLNLGTKEELLIILKN